MNFYSCDPEDFEKVLELKFIPCGWTKKITISKFFEELLVTLWYENEQFSGKRPFGNGGWQSDLYCCLIKNKIIDGSLDEDGYVESFNEEKSAKYIEKLIKYIFSK